MKRIIRTIAPSIILVLGIVAFYLVGCSGDDNGGGGPVAPEPNCTSTAGRTVVEMKDNFFSPKDVTISRGDTIIWCNTGNAAHTTTSGTPGNIDGLWNSGTPQASWIQPGGSFQRVFDDTTGTFDYFCIPHAPLGMVGTVTVNP